MKELLPSLTGIALYLLSAFAWHGADADPRPEEFRAAVTDMPGIIDMSHADPRTWHSLPAAGPGVHVWQELAENKGHPGNG